jgi:ectoine hydroxylase
MTLSPAELKQFDELGYLFFPNCFNEEEIALLRDDAEAILKLDRQEIWREKSAPRVPRLPRILSTRHSVCWPAIRG